MLQIFIVRNYHIPVLMEDTHVNHVKMSFEPYDVMLSKVRMRK